MKDVAHQNPRQLERGDKAHEQHGRTVAFAQIAQQAGLLLIAASFFMGAALILWFFIL